ncbi:hypothetical protein LEN26_006177 [Aphanomyces euteiches]|nr:hypothetical protein AeMF1_013060 [Aphanomyces euteiches]KAH9136444.1 hypothetical protein LEN26_006177 [Aphanomyces euteiches]KAH9196036.1 hypothetical protein AeNC1_001972 [Aphanomyces euteiches]
MTTPPSTMSLPDPQRAVCALPVAFTVQFGTTCIITAALIWYLRRQRTTASRGSARAARKVVLPAFEPMLWILGFISFAFFIFFALAMSLEWTVWYDNVWREAVLQGQLFSVLFIGIFLHQKTVSAAAIVRSVLLALVIAVLAVLVCAVLKTMVAADAVPLVQYIMSTVIRGCVCLLFVHMIIWPMDRATPRAIRKFGSFVLVYLAILFAAQQVHYKHSHSSEAFTSAACICMCFAPFFIWRLLVADTMYWRGLGQRAIGIVNQNTIPCQPIQEVMSSKGLHLLLELHRHDLVDFAHLEFDAQIGRGASAVVYQGTLHSNEPVAIKVYTPAEISEATVAEFSQEAAVWSALDHPNITSFYGLCVSPPTICLVSELCQTTLADHIRKKRSLLAQLCLLIDAARAVAYLHSFSPSLLHRDIKPSNFLLDSSNVLKLSDFGESRVAAHPLDMRRSMTVRGTVEYMAPEVIDGKQGHATYNTRADVYSLAITMWDVLHPGSTKFPSDPKNHMHLFELVLDGARPPIRSDLPEALQDLLNQAWHPEPQERISAKCIAEQLELLLDEFCFGIAQTIVSSRSQSTERSGIAGTDIINELILQRVAGDQQEAIRVGNALIDSGYLHEVKHSAPFSANHRYIFDSPTNSNRLSTTSAISSTPSNDPTGTTRCRCRQYAQGIKRRRRRNSLVRTFKKKRNLDDNLLTAELLNDQDFAEEAMATITV